MDDNIAERLRGRDSEYQATEDALSKAIQESSDAMRKNALQAVEIARAKEEAVQAKVFIVVKRKGSGRK